MEPPEIIDVDPGEEISCDGGKTYGHPKVYLTLGDEGYVDCYYCGRRFRVRGAAGGAQEKHQAAA